MLAHTRVRQVKAFSDTSTWPPSLADSITGIPGHMLPKDRRFDVSAIAAMTHLNAPYDIVRVTDIYSEHGSICLCYSFQ